MRLHRTPIRGASVLTVPVTSLRASTRPSRSENDGGSSTGARSASSRRESRAHALEAPSRSHGRSCPTGTTSSAGFLAARRCRSNRARDDSRTCTSTRRPPTSTIRTRRSTGTDRIGARPAAHWRFQPRLGNLVPGHGRLETGEAVPEAKRSRRGSSSLVLRVESMGRALRIAPAGGSFHVTTRGNRLRPCTATRSTARGFSRCSTTSLGVLSGSVLAYCQMTNHYHLVVHTPRATLSAGMQRLNGLHAQRFNWRHELRRPLVRAAVSLSTSEAG